MHTDLAQSLYDTLAQTTSDTRLYEFTLRNPDGLEPWLDGTGLLVLAFSSQDGLHQLPRTDILVAARQAGLPLEAFIGRTGSLHISQADRSRCAITGLVSQITHLGSDGGLVRYHIQLSAWLGLLSHSSQSRVWQDQPVDAIIDSVFAAYQPLAHWQWSGDARQLLNQLPVRRYCVQYRETPLAFVSRLLAEDGLSWRVDPDVPAAPYRAQRHPVC